MKPSIIFFDEVDALAPIRNTRDGQTHASVVATLLAEMDGLCDRFVSQCLYTRFNSAWTYTRVVLISVMFAYTHVLNWRRSMRSCTACVYKNWRKRSNKVFNRVSVAYLVHSS